MVSKGASSSQRIDDLARLKQASAALGVPFIRLVNRTIPPEVLNRLPLPIARQIGMVAYEEAHLSSGRRILRLAVSDPKILEHEAPAPIAKLHRDQGMVIEVALTPKTDLEAIWQTMKPAPSSSTPVSSTSPGPAASRPVVQVIEKQVLVPSTDKGASPAKISLVNRTILDDVLNRIPYETAAKYRVIVFDVDEPQSLIHVALEEPSNPQVQELLSFITDRNGLKVATYQTDPASIDAGLAQYHQKGSSLPAQESPNETPSRPAKPTNDEKSTSSTKSVVVNQSSTNKANQPKENPVIEALKNEAATSHAKAAVSTIPQIRVTTGDLATPDLRVPSTEASSLIPASADVERDLVAVVGEQVDDTTTLESIVRTGFIPKIVGAVVLYAIKLGASDIHIQADGEDLLVRFRIDGILSDIIRMPLSLQAPIVSRIKILAKLKIDEQRVPQDGRFTVVATDKEIDLRISTFPTVQGEKVVIRLLDKSTGLLKFERLGLIGSRLEALRKEIHRPYGVILATGPTGSGKSTTLYAILQDIAGPTVNVMTLEDPVEYEIPGIAQAEIRPKIGFGFAEGLRSILRQDPNIIMVGEIRDTETANMMTHAALTGHLVLSTLHTNDAAGALPRLMDMGVEPFLLTSAMNAVLAQRLVRKLCDKCRVAWTPPAAVDQEVRTKLEAGQHAEFVDRMKSDLTYYKAVGCDACHEGYHGRIGIYEVLVMSDGIEELAVKKAPASEIAARAVADGMVTMEQDGLGKVIDGLTTLEEVWRVIRTE